MYIFIGNELEVNPNPKVRFLLDAHASMKTSDVGVFGCVLIWLPLSQMVLLMDKIVINLEKRRF